MAPSANSSTRFTPGTDQAWLSRLSAVLVSILVHASVCSAAEPNTVINPAPVAGSVDVNTPSAKDSGFSTEEFLKVGEARLKVLLWSVYDSRLYTPTGIYNDGDRPLRLEIQYLMDIKSEALVERTLTEWDAMGRSHPRRFEWLETLEMLWPDIQETDTLALELDAEGLATFRLNGEFLGRLEDPDFGREFIDIWLSQDCTRPELRSSLLGVGD